MGNTSSSVSPKELTFHHGNAQQVLRVYPGTPRDVVLNLALQRLSLSSTTTIDEILLLDEDGTPVAFFPDALPNGCHLYILLERAVVTGETPKFRWSADVNNHPNISYGLSACGTILFTGRGGNTSSFSMAILASDKFFTSKSGIVKWRYKWDVEGPYRAIGLLDESDYNHLLMDDYGDGFAAFPLLHRTSDMSFYEMTGECTLDMTRRTFTVSHDGAQRKVYDNIPDKVWVGVTVKRGNAVPFEVPDKRLLQIFFDEDVFDGGDMNLELF